MAAYLLVDCDVTDPARYETYKKLAPGAIAKYGGRYLVRGGAMSRLEGDWQPKRVVVLEFPDGAALAGMAVIAGSGLVLAWHERRSALAAIEEPTAVE